MRKQKRLYKPILIRDTMELIDWEGEIENFKPETLQKIPVIMKNTKTYEKKFHPNDAVGTVRSLSDYQIDKFYTNKTLKTQRIVRYILPVLKLYDKSLCLFFYDEVAAKFGTIPTLLLESLYRNPDLCFYVYSHEPVTSARDEVKKQGIRITKGNAYVRLSEDEHELLSYSFCKKENTSIIIDLRPYNKVTLQRFDLDEPAAFNVLLGGTYNIEKIEKHNTYNDRFIYQIGSYEIDTLLKDRRLVGMRDALYISQADFNNLTKSQLMGLHRLSREAEVYVGTARILSEATDGDTASHFISNDISFHLSELCSLTEELTGSGSQTASEKSRPK